MFTRIMISTVLMISITGYAQDRGMISGNIVDAKTQEPLIGANVFIVATLVVVINALTDMLYAYLDPRIRLT